MDNEERTQELPHEEENENLVYEVGYHVASTVSEEDVQKASDQIKSLIEEKEGSVIATGQPALCRLAYPIFRNVQGKRDKYDTSYFGWIKFESTVEAILEIKETLDKNEHVLRFLIIKTAREDTRIARHILTRRPDEAAPIKSPSRPRESVSQQPISEAELDKTIEELVKES